MRFGVCGRCLSSVCVRVVVRVMEEFVGWWVENYFFWFLCYGNKKSLPRDESTTGTKTLFCDCGDLVSYEGDIRRLSLYERSRQRR